MTGPEGTRAVLDAELSLDVGCGQGGGCATSTRGTNHLVKWAAAGAALLGGVVFERIEPMLTTH